MFNVNGIQNNCSFVLCLAVWTAVKWIPKKTVMFLWVWLFFIKHSMMQDVFTDAKQTFLCAERLNRLGSYACVQCRTKECHLWLLVTLARACCEALMEWRREAGAVRHDCSTGNGWRENELKARALGDVEDGSAERCHSRREDRMS